jgi:hypothetical protein
VIDFIASLEGSGSNCKYRLLGRTKPAEIAGLKTKDATLAGFMEINGVTMTPAQMKDLSFESEEGLVGPAKQVGTVWLTMMDTCVPKPMP